MNVSDTVLTFLLANNPTITIYDIVYTQIIIQIGNICFFIFCHRTKLSFCPNFTVFAKYDISAPTVINVKDITSYFFNSENLKSSTIQIYTYICNYENIYAARMHNTHRVSALNSWWIDTRTFFSNHRCSSS